MEFLILLLPLLMELLEKCQEDRSAEEMVRGLEKPGVLEIVATRKAIRKEEGLRGRRLRKRIHEVFEAISELTEREIVEVVREARSES